MKEMQGKHAFVSFAGTNSVGSEMVSTPMTNLHMPDGSRIFKQIFGNGYHLSLLTYANRKCFRTIQNQVTQVTACVMDFFEMFGKDEFLPFLYISSALPMVQDSDFQEKDVFFILGTTEYDRQKRFGYGIGGASHEQRVAWGMEAYEHQRQTGTGIGGASHKQQVA